MTAVSLSSRYQRNIIGIQVDRNGIPRQAILHSFPQPAWLQVSEHLWTAYDRVDILAAAYLGNETSWWMIASANPTILDWTNVPVGNIIRIPNVA